MSASKSSSKGSTADSAKDSAKGSAKSSAKGSSKGSAEDSGKGAKGKVPPGTTKGFFTPSEISDHFTKHYKIPKKKEEEKRESVTPEIDEPQRYIPEPVNPPSPPYLRHREPQVAIDYHFVLDVEINLNPVKLARLLWKRKEEYGVIFHICSFSGKETGKKTAFVLQNEGELRGIFQSFKYEDIVVHDKCGKKGKVAFCKAREIGILIDDNESII